MVRKKGVNIFANRLARETHTAHTTRNANAGDLQSFFTSVFGSKDISGGQSGTVVINGANKLPSFNGTSTFEKYKTTDDVIRMFLNDGVLQAITSGDTSVSTMVDRVVLNSKKNPLSVRYDRINNVQSNVSIDHTANAMNHFKGLVNRSRNGDVKGRLHVLDTETIGTTSTDHYWNHGYMTEFAAVTQDLSQDYNETSVTTSANIARGLTEKDANKLQAEIFEAMRTDPTLSNPKNKSLRVSADRAFRYGGDSTLTDSSKGYFSVLEVAGGLEDGMDLTSEAVSNRIKKGFSELKRYHSQTVLDDKLHMKKSDAMFIRAMESLQSDLNSGNGMIAGYNYNSFDRRVIDTTIGQIYSNLKDQYASKLPQDVKNRVKMTMDYMENAFGTSMAIKTPKGTVLDFYNPLRAVAALDGISSVYAGNAMPDITSTSLGRLTQESIVSAIFGRDEASAHGALTDVTDLIKLMMKPMDNGETYFNFLDKKIGAMNKKSYSKNIRENQFYQLTGALGWEQGGRNIFSFMHDSSNDTYYFGQDANSGHIFNNGNVTTMGYSVGSHGKKGQIIRTGRVRRVDFNSNFLPVSQEFQELAGGSMYIMPYQVATTGMIDDISQQATQTYYLVASTEEELSSLISNKSKFVGQHNGKNLTAAREFGDGALGVAHLRGRIEFNNNRLKAEQFNNKVMDNLYSKYTEIQDRATNIVGKMKNPATTLLSAGVSQQVVNSAGSPVLGLDATIGINRYIHNNLLNGDYGIKEIDHMLPQTKQLEDMFLNKLESERNVFNMIFTKLHESKNFVAMSKTNKDAVARQVYDDLMMKYSIQQTGNSDYASAVEFARGMNVAPLTKKEKQNILHINMSRYSNNPNKSINSMGVANDVLSVDLSSQGVGDFADRIFTKMYGHTVIKPENTDYYRKGAVRTTLTNIIYNEGLQGNKLFRNVVKQLGANDVTGMEFDEKTAIKDFLTAMRSYKAVKGHESFMVNNDVLLGINAFSDAYNVGLSKGFNAFVTPGMVNNAVDRAMTNPALNMKGILSFNTGKRGYNFGKAKNQLFNANVFDLNKVRQEMSPKLSRSELANVMKVASRSKEAYKDFAGGIVSGLGQIDGVTAWLDNGAVAFQYTDSAGVKSEVMNLKMPELRLNKNTGAMEIINGGTRIADHATISLNDTGQIKMGTVFSDAIDKIGIGYQLNKLKQKQADGTLTAKDFFGLLPKGLHENSSLSGGQGDIDANLWVSIDDNVSHDLLKRALNDNDFLKLYNVDANTKDKLLKAVTKEDPSLNPELRALADPYILGALKHYHGSGEYGDIINGMNIDVSKKRIEHGIFSSGGMRTPNSIAGMWTNFQRTVPYTEFQYTALNGNQGGHVLTSANTAARTERNLFGKSYSIGVRAGTLEMSGAGIQDLITRDYNKIVEMNGIEKNIRKHGVRVANELRNMIVTLADFSNVSSRYMESQYGQISAYTKRFTASMDIVSPISDPDNILTADNRAAYAKAKNAIGEISFDGEKIIYKRGSAQYFDKNKESLLMEAYGGTAESYVPKEESMLSFVVTGGANNTQLTDRQINKLIMDNKHRFKKSGEYLKNDNAHNLRVLMDLFQENNLDASFHMNTIYQRDIVKMHENEAEKGMYRMNLSGLGAYDERIQSFFKGIGRQDLLGAALTDEGIRGVIGHANAMNPKLNIANVLKSSGFKNMSHLMSSIGNEKHILSDVFYGEVLKNKDIVSVTNFDAAKHANYDSLINKHLNTMYEILKNKGYTENSAALLIEDMLHTHQVTSLDRSQLYAKNGRIYMDDSVRLGGDIKFNHGSLHHMYKELENISGQKLIHENPYMRNASGAVEQENKTMYGMYETASMNIEGKATDVLIGMKSYNTVGLLVEDDIYQTSFNVSKALLNEIDMTKKKVKYYRNQAEKVSIQVAKEKRVLNNARKHLKTATTAEDIYKHNQTIEQSKNRHTMLAKREQSLIVARELAIGQMYAQDRLINNIKSNNKTVRINQLMLEKISSNTINAHDYNPDILTNSYNALNKMSSSSNAKIKYGDMIKESFDRTLSGIVDKDFNPLRGHKIFNGFIDSLYRDKFYQEGQTKYSVGWAKKHLGSQGDKVINAYQQAALSILDRSAERGVHLNHISTDAVKSEVNRLAVEQSHYFNVKKKKIAGEEMGELVNGLSNTFETVSLDNFIDTYGVKGGVGDKYHDKSILLDWGNVFDEIDPNLRYTALPGKGAYYGNQEVRDNAYAQISVAKQAYEEFLANPSQSNREKLYKIANNMESSVSNMRTNKRGEVRSVNELYINEKTMRHKATAIGNVHATAKDVDGNIASKEAAVIDEFMNTAQIDGVPLAKLEAAGGPSYDYAGISKKSFRDMGYFDKEVMEQYGAKTETEMEEILKKKGARMMLYRDPVVYGTSVVQAQVFLNNTTGEGISAASHTILKMFGDFDGDSLSLTKMDIKQVDANGRVRSFNHAQYDRIKNLMDKEYFDFIKENPESNYEEFRRWKTSLHNNAGRETKAGVNDKALLLMRRMGMSHETFEEMRKLDAGFMLESIKYEQAAWKKEALIETHKGNNALKGNSKLIDESTTTSANLANVDQNEFMRVKERLNSRVSSWESDSKFSGHDLSKILHNTKNIEDFLGANSEYLMSKGLLNDTDKIDLESYHNMLRYKQEFAIKGASSAIGNVDYGASHVVNLADRIAERAENAIVRTRGKMLSKGLTSVKQELLQAKHKAFSEGDTRVTDFTDTMSQIRSKVHGPEDVKKRNAAIDKLEGMLDYDNSVIKQDAYVNMYHENEGYFRAIGKSVDEKSLIEKHGAEAAEKIIHRAKYNAVKDDLMGSVRSIANSTENDLGRTVEHMKEYTPNSAEVSRSLINDLHAGVLPNDDLNMAKLRDLERTGIQSEDFAERTAVATAGKMASNLSSKFNGRGMAFAALGMAAGIGVLAAAGRPLHKGGAQPNDNHQTPVPNFSDQAPGAMPQGRGGYIINVKADTKQSMKNIKAALHGAVISGTGMSPNVNMSIRSTNRTNGFTDKDIQKYISNYM